MCQVTTKLPRLLVVLAFICAAVLAASRAGADAAFTTPARRGASSGPPLDVADALRMSSYEVVLDTGIQKMEALAGLLARVTDERSAREVCPAAERCYIEFELVSVRLTMLPPPTTADRARLQDRQARFTAAQAALNAEVARIAASASLAQHARSVVFPLNEQLKLVRAQEANSLTALLQTVRSQIELYKSQHRDQRPDFRSRAWNQMLSKTSADGAVTPRGEFGPYLQVPPRNALNGNTRILIVRGHPGRDFRYDRGDAGFVYDESSGRLWALDAAGRLFNEAGSARASAE